MTIRGIALALAMLGASAALGQAGAAQAQALPPGYGAQHSYPDPYRARYQRAGPMAPDQIVQRGVDRLTGFLLGVPDVTAETLGGFLEVEIAPLFDFAYMAKWAAGRYWRRLDEGERARLAVTLQGLFLDALARNLGTYTEPLPRVDVFPTRRSTPTEAQVVVRVTGENGPPVRLEFRFYWNGRSWKMYDVTANGASAVAYYRTHFARQLRRRGPGSLEP